MKLSNHRRAVVLIIIILITVAIAALLRKPKKTIPPGMPQLTLIQRTEIQKKYPCSADALTPDSSKIKEIRSIVKHANIIICVLDAARVDHFGCYGYQRETTPNVDEIAKESYIFQNHFCQYPSTLPSTASLFTAEYPDTHGVTDPPFETHADDVIEFQPEPEFTFPIGLEAAGYKTVLFSANSRASPISGIGLGFQEAYYHQGIKKHKQNGEHSFSPSLITTTFNDWLAKNGDAKFFAYLHFTPPHEPYRQPDEFTDVFKDSIPPDFDAADHIPFRYLFPIKIDYSLQKTLPLPKWINEYDANLRYSDWGVGEVVRLLKKKDLLEKTIFIVTSDHGEAMGEHGYIWHSEGIYNEVTHIPCVIRLPGKAKASKKLGAITQTIDILPTIYDLLRIPFPVNEVQGKSLVPLMFGHVEKIHDYSFSRSFDPSKYMIRDERYALLLYTNPKWRALYDSLADPDFKKNVYADNPLVVNRLYQTFVRFALAQKFSPTEFLEGSAKKSARRTGRKVKLSQDIKRELKTLGYLK